VTSSSFYKLTKTQQINAGDQFYQIKGADKNSVGMNDYYYRMPLKEFNVVYRMRSAYVNGYFDHNKEILFPESKNGVEGYKVITPFYYYYTPNMDFEHPKQVNGQTEFDKIALRAGMAVDRGW
jgi:hypothetical protein